MWAKFIFFFEISQFTSALPGYTTAGTEFVFSCPEISNEAMFTALLFVVTDELTALVNLYTPTNFTQGYFPVEERLLTVLQYSSVTHELSLHCRVSSSGLYTASRANSSVPVRAILHIDSYPSLCLTLFNLIPKESSFSKYFVSTYKGHVFMSVHSFRQTQLTVSFPIAKVDFEIPCFGDYRAYLTCKPNTTVDISLNPYQVWYLYVAGPHSDLHNTVVESNTPVFVLAGNKKPPAGSSRSHAGITSTKPMAAWGKTYLVPHPSHDTFGLVLRINADSFPLRVKVKDGHRQSAFLATALTEYLHMPMTQPVVVTSGTPFGLYALMPLHADTSGQLTDVASVNVIPLEQWMDGFIRVENRLNGNISLRHTLVILSTADPKEVVLRHVEPPLSWTRLESIGNQSVYHAQVSLTDSPARIFLQNTFGKLMLYVLCQMNERSHAVFPYDFYQGEIFKPDCVKVAPVASDGVDNDCDGVIDEEINNDEDDDGDGEVDEDLVETYTDGQWSAWTLACRIRCHNEEIVQYVRECAKTPPSRFGRRCVGKTEDCGLHGTCPARCSEEGAMRVCRCRSTCFECKSNTSVCESCIPGYFQTPYCLRKCPDGWTGVNCIRGPRTWEDFSNLSGVGKHVTTDPTPSFQWVDASKETIHSRLGERGISWLVVFLPITIHIIIGVVLCTFAMRTKYKERRFTLQKRRAIQVEHKLSFELREGGSDENHHSFQLEYVAQPAENESRPLPYVDHGAENAEKIERKSYPPSHFDHKAKNAEDIIPSSKQFVDHDAHHEDEMATHSP